MGNFKFERPVREYSRKEDRELNPDWDKNYSLLNDYFVEGIKGQDFNDLITAFIWYEVEYFRLTQQLSEAKSLLDTLVDDEGN